MNGIRVKGETMRLASTRLPVIVLATLGCDNRLNVQCLENSNCDLTTGGICAVAPTGNHWCAYYDPACPGNYRFADQDVGDGVSGMCVAQTDAGVDGLPGQACRLRVAFVDGAPSTSGRDDGSGHRQVWVTNPDGSGAINVSQAAGTDSAHPSWSPDGTKLAFASNPAGHYDIFVVNANGSVLTNLTAGSDFPSDASAPVWSPDGTHIAFVYEGTLWSMNVDGSSAGQVSSLMASRAFAWSPDGRKLVFEGGPPVSSAALYVATMGDGSLPLKITSENTLGSNPTWAPSPKITFDNNSDVFTVSGDGTDLLNVTNDATGNSNAISFDNGRPIMFSHGREIWSIPAAGGMATRVTSNSDVHSIDIPNAISGDGELLVFSRVTSIVIPPGEVDSSYQLGVSRADGNSLHLFNAPGGNNATEGRFTTCH